MVRGLLALVVVVVGITCWPRAARANDVIRDGDAFQVDLTPAHACFIAPAELRNAEACEGFEPEAARASAKVSEAHVLASALVHLSDDAVGYLSLLRAENKASSVHRGTAEAYVTGYGKGVAKGLSKTAKSKMTNAFVVPSPRGAEHGGFLRGSVDISDSNPTPLLALSEHHELVSVYTKDAAYILVVMGPARATAAITKIVEDAMVTTTVAHPIPAYEGKDVSGQLGEIVGATLVLAVGLIVGAYAHEHKKRAAAAAWLAREAAGPHAPTYGYYGRHGDQPPPPHGPPPSGPWPR